MKTIDIIRDANTNLLRNKLRSFLTILAIFIGSFSIVSTSAIQAGVNNFIDSQVNSYGGEGYIAIASQDSFDALEGLQNAGDGPIEYTPDKRQTSASPITDKQLEDLKNLESIDADSVTEQKSISISYIESKKTDKKYLIGAEGLPPGHINVDTVSGTAPNNDEKDEWQITLQGDYPEALGYTDENIVGKTVTLVVVDQYTKTEKKFDAKVVGVIAPGVVTMGSSYVNRALAEAIYEENAKYYPEEMKNRVIAVSAFFDYEKYSEQEVKDQLKEIGLAGMTMKDMIGSIKSFFDVILTVFKIFGLIALLAAAIGIVNTLFMSVQERTREIGLDKALGMSSGKVFASFSVEAIMLGFWGSVFGIVVSMIIGNAVNVAFHAEGGFLESFPTFNLATYTIPDVISVTVLIMLIAFLAGTLPARRAAHKNPIDALRYE